MPDLPGTAAETPEPRCPGQRPDDDGIRGLADRGGREGLRGARADGPRIADCQPRPARDPRSPPVPARGGRRLPDPWPQRCDALGGRRAAHPAGDADRIEPDGCALRSRRTVDRAASARQPRAARDARAAARSGQHGRGRRARRRDDPVGRLRHRPGTRSRGARRSADLSGIAGQASGERQRLADGRLLEWGAVDRDAEAAASGDARKHRHQGRPREQPEGYRRRDSAGRADHRHRRQRVGEVDTRQRDPVSLAGARAVSGRRRARRAQHDRRHRPDRQGDPDRPVADRAHAAVRIPPPTPGSSRSSGSCSRCCRKRKRAASVRAASRST